MELLGSAEFNDQQVKILTRHVTVREDEIQELLSEYVIQSNQIWINEGQQRKTKDQTKMQSLVIPASDYRESVTRLRKAARQQDLSLRIGDITGPPESQIYVPYVAMSKPEPASKQGRASGPDLDWPLLLEVLRTAQGMPEFKDRRAELAAMAGTVGELVPANTEEEVSALADVVPIGKASGQ